MCHTHQTQDMPLANPYSGAPTGDPGMDAANSLASASVPKTVPVTGPTGFGSFLHNMGAGMIGAPGGTDDQTGQKLTKWGMLARVIGPALQGGLIGLAGGKGHPQGGFGAAQDFYNQQRAYQMQKMLLERQQVNDQFRNFLEYARMQHLMNQPYFTGRSLAPSKSVDDNGKSVWMRPNPWTGKPEAIEGFAPPEEDPNYSKTDTDQGIAVYDKHGKAPTKLLTLPDPTESALAPSGVTTLPNRTGQSSRGIPLGAPNPNDSTGVVTLGGKVSPMFKPRVPGSGTASQSPSGINAGAGQIPRTAPGTSTGAVTGSAIPLMPFDRHTDTLKERAADALRVKHPNWTDDQILAQIEADARGPDRAANNAAKKDATLAAIEDHVDAAMQASGNDPDKAITMINSDKNVPSQYKSMMRNRIRELARPGRPQKKQSALDMLRQSTPPGQEEQQ